jgi:RNA polymerase subunit RPABC4/transcription elongation factor Spt4
MAELTNCANCNGQTTEDSDFCPHCGHLFKETPPIQCETDSGIEATGVCIICQKLLCPRCEKIKDNRMFCIEHEDVEVDEDWAMVFESTTISETESTKNFLEVNRFRTITMESNTDTKGDAPISIFVPLPDYLRAKNMLEKVLQ